MGRRTGLKKFKSIFEERKANILKSIASKEDILIDGGDEVDLVQGKIINEMTERLSLREKESLNRINVALKKIEDGSFGICEECEEPILDKRLLAVPDCNTCIACAEYLEKQAKQYKA